MRTESDHRLPQPRQFFRILRETLLQFGILLTGPPRLFLRLFGGVLHALQKFIQGSCFGGRRSRDQLFWFLLAWLGGNPPRRQQREDEGNQETYWQFHNKVWVSNERNRLIAGFGEWSGRAIRDNDTAY